MRTLVGLIFILMSFCEALGFGTLDNAFRDLMLGIILLGG